LNACVTELSARWPLGGHQTLRVALEAAWSDPGRGYHDVRHLTEVLDRLDELAEAGERYARTEVLLAAWFHDGVYDGSADAEERSARWAEDSLGEADCDAAEVARLVRVTRDHRVAPGDRDGAALCDADLAVLAAPAARYAEYVADVRREYAHVPDRDFAAGRLAVLAGLVDKAHLFETGHGRANWEGPARANLAAELVSLRQVVGPGGPATPPGPSAGAAPPP
jgi:predicted metal-dependent HD superfamily phosphohydrolase